MMIRPPIYVEAVDPSQADAWLQRAGNLFPLKLRLDPSAATAAGILPPGLGESETQARAAMDRRALVLVAGALERGFRESLAAGSPSPTAPLGPERVDAVANDLRGGESQ